MRETENVLKSERGCKMSEKQDFERVWLDKFSGCLDEIVGPEIRQEVMTGSEGLSSHSSRQEVIDWSKGAMERLDSLVGEEESKEIMTGCACQYPKSDVQEIRKKYEATKDIDLVHQMLQEQFESFLKNSLGLSDELVEEIVKRGWGSAGVRKGNTIIATKIPKSGYCGAGFYKGIWEEILQKPVEVEVLETVLRGDEVCKIAIYLPPDCEHSVL